MVYQAVTEGVLVRARPTYLADQSDPDENRWVWAYRIEIENHGEEAVQLLARRWTITDAAGRVQEVRGPGVVGEQPVIQPGERYTYNSGCPLPTSSGAMVGAYQMTRAGGGLFEAAIPAFSLDMPRPRTLN